MLIPSNRTKRECILSRLCFLVLSVWVSLPSAAQNNPYKIDDALYPIYQRASKQARQQEGLLVADTLYQQALKLGDKKAQCLAIGFIALKLTNRLPNCISLLFVIL